MEETIEEIKAELELGINEIIQVFIGNPCNLSYGKLLELAFNNFFTSKVFKDLISSDSFVEFDSTNADYESKTLDYNATVVVKGEIETVTFNTIYTANLG